MLLSGGLCDDSKCFIISNKVVMDLRTLRLCTCVLIIILTFDVAASDRRHRLLVDTSSGWLMGKQMMLDGVPVFTYFGVPYAEPPVGPKRFRPPVPKARMNQIFNATKFGPICPQNTSSLDFPFKNPHHIMKEDCLSLNIYVPLYASKSRPVAVMVWIHGGGYYSGSGNMYNASILSAVGEIIVVTVNYRLGALGFLSTEDDYAVGNYGLWDQFLALEWIQQNIYEFGGDPNRVTLFGQSSGGASVQLHAMSPVSQRTFHRVISQSGSALAPWAIHDDALSQARKLADRLGCRTPSNLDLMDNHMLIACLQKKEFKDIVANQDIGEPGPTFQLAWGPVVDGNFLPYHPETFFSKQEGPMYKAMAEKDILAGVNSQDGAVLFQLVITPHLRSMGLDPTKNGISEHVYDKKLISPIVENSFEGKDENVKKAILHQYTNWMEPKNDNERVKSLIDFLSDQHFIAGSILFAKEHFNASRSLESGRGHGTTFLYLFDHIPSWLNGSYWTDGSDHFHELPFVFGLPMVPGFQMTVTPEERLLSLAMINYWANFAKTGNPNIPRHPSQKAVWPEFTIQDERYMEFSGDFSDQSVSQNLYPVRMRFWLDLLPNLLQTFSQKRPCIELPEESKDEEMEPIVETAQGIIQGYHDSQLGMEWDMFLGIPYAAPPIGPLRFHKPRVSRPWKGTLNATSHRPSCIQRRNDIRRYLSFNSLPVQHSMSEDCLYLNIYVPYDVTVAKMENFAVMIFIHGGSFKEGTASYFDGRALSWNGKVIVVTFNYRLGALGFLSTEEGSSPGNYGLFDQQMAFQWVKKNIDRFGGDPDRITIFGQSAGSMSALAHALSPQSQKIIRRVIAQSGAIPAWRPPGPFPRQQARALAERMGCESSFMYYIVECLRTKDPVEIMEVVLPGNGSFAFPPVFDGDFFPHDPRYSISSANFSNIDLLIGTNDEDGILVATAVLASRNALDYFQKGMSHDELVDTLERGFTNVISSQGDLMAKTLLQNYLDWNDPGNLGKNLKSFIDILGDFYFTAPSIFFADHHAKSNSNTYMYRFTLNPSLRSLVYDPPEYPGKVGADHGDELPFVFGYPLLEEGLTPDASQVDKELSYDMIRYWTNFARFGDPNAMDIPTQWPKYSVESGRHLLDIGRQIVAKNNLRMDRISLWNDIISRMLEVESTAFCSISAHARNQPIDLLSADTSQPPFSSPVVKTEYGLIRGFTKRAHVKVGEGLVDVYTNIPYAKPPVGELRFQHPELPEPWQGIRDGTVTPPACIQPISPEVSLLQDLTDVSEDCLYLRIHAPREENKTDLLPVLVFIDGKDFRHADGVHLDLSNLAAFGKMVVVTLNYRLGSLGFFSTGLNTDVTGNYGLGDIISALTWVQKNIANFGGDPERVTLGGQESGAISAHILLFVPQSEGLFHQMLSFGGSALQPSAVDYIEGRLEKVKTFIEDVGCPTLPYQAMMTCLYSKPAHVFATQNLTHMPDVNFGPVIDRVFITDDMTKLAEDQRFHHVDALFGYDEDYMTELLARSYPDGLMTDEELKDSLESLIVHHLPIYRGAALLTDMITNHYLLKTYSSRHLTNFQTYKGIVTDFLLSVPMELSAKLHSQSGAVSYLYKRPFQNDDTVTKGSTVYRNSYIPVFLGLAFNNHLYNNTYTDQDHYLSVQLMTYISNFATSGNPNHGRQVTTEWPAYDVQDPFYLQIGNRINIEPCTEGKQLDFWVNILPNVANLASAVSKLRFLPQISDAGNDTSSDCSWTTILGLNRTMVHHVIWILIILVGVLMLVTLFLMCQLFRRRRRTPLT